MFILNLIRGAFMGLADSIPGVSGGTIAFIMGFYNKFIDSIHALLSTESIQKKKEALFFLINLGIGWVVGMGLCVTLIANVIETKAYAVSSLFIGLIVAAIPLICSEEKDTIKGNYIHIIYTIIGIAVVALITYFSPTSHMGGPTEATEITSGVNYFTGFSLPMALYLFFAGAVAISAMVLPGISGSTLLLIFGLYAKVMTSVKEVLHFNFEPVIMLIFFGLGIIAGISISVAVLSKLLKTHRSEIVYLILGLMIGSIYAVIMGPTTFDVPQAPLSFGTFSIIFFIIGIVVIVGLELLKRVMPSED